MESSLVWTIWSYLLLCCGLRSYWLAVHSDTFCDALATRHTLKREVWWRGHCEDVERFIRQYSKMCGALQAASTGHARNATHGILRRRNGGLATADRLFSVRHAALPPTLQSNGCVEFMVHTVKRGLRAFTAYRDNFEAYLASCYPITGRWRGVMVAEAYQCLWAVNFGARQSDRPKQGCGERETRGAAGHGWRARGATDDRDRLRRRGSS